ncbi:MAG: hypothetical protein JW984_00200 [Deltaproteobacteria bacterium]|uniref:Uncharacterized protein n=1 Tax=Candidatus Zymogenus saltonus TaxID=2844893 RepID=A0A9D8KA58_9DELT|nr:hypothetical protein [Candidatus Zymogenus saltonus]
MKEEIAKNDYYEMYVDENKNRYYSKLKGFWQKASEVPNYIDDNKKALDRLSPGFTLLVDNIDVKPPAQECMDLHVKAVEMCNKAGIGETALIVNQMIVKFAGGRALREGGIEEKSRQFNDPKEAEDWLDGKNV